METAAEGSGPPRSKDTSFEKKGVVIKDEVQAKKEKWQGKDPLSPRSGGEDPSWGEERVMSMEGEGVFSWWAY